MHSETNHDIEHSPPLSLGGSEFLNEPSSSSSSSPSMQQQQLSSSSDRPMDDDTTAAGNTMTTVVEPNDGNRDGGGGGIDSYLPSSSNSSSLSPSTSTFAIPSPTYLSTGIASASASTSTGRTPSRRVTLTPEEILLMTSPVNSEEGDDILTNTSDRTTLDSIVIEQNEDGHYEDTDSHEEDDDDDDELDDNHAETMFEVKVRESIHRSSLARSLERANSKAKEAADGSTTTSVATAIVSTSSRSAGHEMDLEGRHQQLQQRQDDEHRIHRTTGPLGPALVPGAVSVVGINATVSVATTTGRNHADDYDYDDLEEQQGDGTVEDDIDRQLEVVGSPPSSSSSVGPSHNLEEQTSINNDMFNPVRGRGVDTTTPIMMATPISQEDLEEEVRQHLFANTATALVVSIDERLAHHDGEHVGGAPNEEKNTGSGRYKRKRFLAMFQKSSSGRNNNLKIAVCIGLFMVLTVVALIVALVVMSGEESAGDGSTTGDGGSDSSGQSSPNSSTSSSLSPDDVVTLLLAQRLPQDSPIDVMGTPQQRAFVFVTSSVARKFNITRQEQILNDRFNDSDADDVNINSTMAEVGLIRMSRGQEDEAVTSFVLATLYYATNNNNTYKNIDGTGNGNINVSTWIRDDHWLDPDVPICDWYGMKCRNNDEGLGRNDDGSIPFLVDTLNLTRNGLYGTIPREIGMLGQIEQGLFLSGNRIFGNIPHTIEFLDDILRLDLSDNLLSGTIPTELGHLTDLMEFNISDNPLLTGTLPAELAQWDRVESIRIQNTSLQGSIPKSVCLTIETIVLFNPTLEFVADCLGIDEDGNDGNGKGTSMGGGIVCSCCTVCCDRNATDGDVVCQNGGR